MSEKKRVRPTLGQVRELESQVAELKEQVRLLEMSSKYSAEELVEMEGYKKKYEGAEETAHMLVQESDGWREKWNVLNAECKTLERSNKYLEDELERQREANKRLSKKNTALYRENQFFKSRGFWARVLNREYIADEE